MHHKCWFLILLWLLCPGVLSADIRIFGLNDFDFGKWYLGSGPLQANANICVAVRPRGPYQVTAYGGGANNSFALLSGRETIPFRMFFNDRPITNGAEELFAGKTLSGLRGRRRGIRRDDCTRPSANLAFLIEEAALQSAASGQYVGTVIIIVGPE